MDGINVLAPAPSARAGEIGMISAIAQWCDCLQGNSPIRDAMEILAKSIDVEAIALTRSSREHDGKVSSLFFDQGLKSAATTPLNRSFAASVLGPYFDRPKPGTVWFKSLTNTESDPKLDSFQRSRHFTELAVIPLSVEEKSAMFLEMHFSIHRGTSQHATINMCAPTLAETWARRKPGLMTELILKRNRPNQQAVTQTALLGTENPAKLSRAEFRVCLLLSRGLSSKRVCDELVISESTLRSHLRSIYAKTETSNKSELLYLLLSPFTQQDTALRATG